jgi:hypothetical protein
MKEQGVANVTVRNEKRKLIVSFGDAKTPDAIMNRLQQLVSFPDRKVSSADSYILTESLFAPFVTET